MSTGTKEIISLSQGKEKKCRGFGCGRRRKKGGGYTFGKGGNLRPPTGERRSSGLLQCSREEKTKSKEKGKKEFHGGRRRDPVAFSGEENNVQIVPWSPQFAGLRKPVEGK